MIALLLALAAWGADLDTTLAAAWKADPALGRAVVTAEPRTTRAPGILRFVDEATADPDAAPFLAARLREGGDPPEVRRALAERLGRVDPSGGAWLVERLVDPDPVVRAALVAALVYAEAEHAEAGLAIAAKDPDPLVRREAAVTRSVRE